MAKFHRDLKAELVEAQRAAQQWEEKFIEAQQLIGDLRGSCVKRDALLTQHVGTIADLRLELGQCSRELQACSASLDELSARVAELEAEESGESARWFASWQKADAALKAANARAEAAERDRDTYGAHAKAHDCARAAAESEAAQWKAKCEAAERAKTEWARLRNDAYASYRNEAEKRERAESERDEWRAKCEAAEQQSRRLEERASEYFTKCERAASEVASLRAEVERLQTSLGKERAAKGVTVHEHRLRIIESGNGITIKAVSVTPEEAAALTTGGARIPAEPTRTDHERAVLEAEK